MPRVPSQAACALPLYELADAFSDAIAVCRDGRIVWASGRLAEWTGRADLEGVEFVTLFEGDDPEPGRAVACAIQPGERPRRLEIRGHALEDGSTAFVMRDVTHVQSLEEELLRIGRELHELQRRVERERERARHESQEREDLLTVVAHELRTPATVIHGYTKLLLAEKVGPLGSEQRHFLEEAAKSCQRLNAFIGNLLEASRQAAHDSPLEVHEGYLTPTLDGVAGFLKPLLEARELRIEVEVAEATLVRFDPVRLEQVLTNLLANAIRYAPAGSAIRVAARPVRVDGLAWVEVSVSDEGSGVAAGDEERIFLPYVRAGADRAAGGLGLGLSICKRIVEAHGGAIHVRSPVGGGCTFAFTLPAPSTQPAPVEEAS